MGGEGEVEVKVLNTTSPLTSTPRSTLCLLIPEVISNGFEEEGGPSRWSQMGQAALLALTAPR